MCARSFAAARDSSDAETLGPRPGPGYVPRDRRLSRRAEGKGILNPAGGREGRPYGDEGEEIPDPAGRSGTGPYGGAEHRASGGHVPPTVSDFRFSWGQILSARGIGFPVWVGADIIRPLCWAPVFS